MRFLVHFLYHFATISNIKMDMKVSYLVLCTITLLYLRIKEKTRQFNSRTQQNFTATQYCNTCFNNYLLWLPCPCTSHKYKLVKPNAIPFEMKFWSAHSFSSPYFKHIKSVTARIFIQIYETAWKYRVWNGCFQQTPAQTITQQPLPSPWQSLGYGGWSIWYVI